MSRVRAVVDRSICVEFKDVKPNDILHISGDETDPIIEKVEWHLNEKLVKLHYKCPTFHGGHKESFWMEAAYANRIFIHDLYNERAEYVEEE